MGLCEAHSMYVYILLLYLHHACVNTGLTDCMCYCISSQKVFSAVQERKGFKNEVLEYSMAFKTHKCKIFDTVVARNERHALKTVQGVSQYTKNHKTMAYKTNNKMHMIWCLSGMRGS